MCNPPPTLNQQFGVKIYLMMDLQDVAMVINKDIHILINNKAILHNNNQNRFIKKPKQRKECIDSLKKKSII